MHRQNARMLNTCGRFDSTHGGILDVHGFLLACQAALHTSHTRNKRTLHTSTNTHTERHTTTQTTRHTFHAHTKHKHHDTFTRHGKTYHQVQTKCMMFFAWVVLLVDVDERDLCLLKMYFAVCCCTSRSKPTCLDHFTQSHVFCSACSSDRTQCASSCGK